MSRRPTTRGPTTCRWWAGTSNGAKSLQTNYRYLKDKNTQIVGDVPAVVFIDWPTDMMTAHLNLPLSEKQDYWRIFGAEAYANGIYPAFHLRDTLDPPAEQYGMLGFFQTYSQFYKDHRSLYRASDYATSGISVGASNVSVSLLVPCGTGARTPPDTCTRSVSRTERVHV